MTNRVGWRVRLATLSEGPVVPSHIEGDFSPGFEKLIDIPYLAKPRSELALRHGAGVEKETSVPREAKAPFAEWQPGPPESWEGLCWA